MMDPSDSRSIFSIQNPKSPHLPNASLLRHDEVGEVSAAAQARLGSAGVPPAACGILPQCKAQAPPQRKPLGPAMVIGWQWNWGYPCTSHTHAFGRMPNAAARMAALPARMAALPAGMPALPAGNVMAP